MKFFFCESCGKRITEKDLEEGKARDKKLNGVYCSQCAKGVLTKELQALGDLPGRKANEASASHPRKRSTSAHAIPVASPRETREARLAPEPRNTKAVLIGLAAGLAVAAVALLMLAGGGEKPVVHAPAAESAEPVPAPATTRAPEPPARPAPRREAVRTVPEPEPDSAEPAPKDPAAEAFEKVLRFEGLKDDDRAGKAAALEDFLREFGGSLQAARARVMLDELKPPGEAPAAAKTPQDPPAGEARAVPPAEAPAKAPVEAAIAPPRPGSGFACELFNGQSFAGAPARASVEPAARLAWPAQGVPGVSGKEGVACRFQGFLVPPASGTYTFVVEGRGAITLRMNGIEIFSTLYGHEKDRESLPIDLEVGKKYRFQACYTDKSVPFVFEVRWRAGSGPAAPLEGMLPETAEQAPPRADWKGGWKFACGKLGSEEILGTRNEIAVNADFGNGPPSPEAPHDQFWATWSGLVTAPKSGEYVFTLDADAGARVCVNDLAILDTTGGTKQRVRSNPVPLEECKTYLVRVEMVEFDWVAFCRLYWSFGGEAEVLVRAALPDAAPTGELPPIGFLAEYWNMGDEKPAVTRIEDRAGADWLHASPAPGIKNDKFCGRWTGWVTPPADCDYTFLVDADAGARLSIDDVVLFDKLCANGEIKEAPTLHLTGGKHYFVKLEFQDYDWVARLSFRWKSAPMPETWVRAEQPRARKAGQKDYGKIDHGLLAEYAAGRATVRRMEAALNHYFGTSGSPDPQIPENGWNAKWTGFLKIETSGVYVFRFSANNAGEMKLARTLVAKGTEKGVESKPIPLQKGGLYPVEFTLIDRSWASGIELQWKPPGKTEFEPLPLDAFVPPAAAAALRRNVP
ncbi:MAG: hypothetical protein KIS92_02405 [Planctomycetota bacterium]|nr:hypothetical protein [Planctomycetota bacterium]